MFELVETSSAYISECGLYRYELFRRVAAAGLCFAFFGVNPSTADADAEDQTTMKWRGFTLRNGGGSYCAGNPFALRATNVKELSDSAVDPVGPLNNHCLGELIKRADVLVPCWGSRAKVDKRLHRHFDALMDRLLESGKPVKTFGLTKSGDPKHPLVLGYDTPLIDYRGKK